MCMSVIRFVLVESSFIHVFAYNFWFFQVSAHSASSCDIANASVAYDTKMLLALPIARKCSRLNTPDLIPCTSRTDFLNSFIFFFFRFWFYFLLFFVSAFANVHDLHSKNPCRRLWHRIHIALSLVHVENGIQCNTQLANSCNTYNNYIGKSKIKNEIKKEKNENGSHVQHSASSTYGWIHWLSLFVILLPALALISLTVSCDDILCNFLLISFHFSSKFK